MSHKMMISDYPLDPAYAVKSFDDILTPALLVYPDIIESNIDRTLHLLDGNADRWRAHIKTSKLAFTLKMLIARGVRNFKCATTLELLTACQSGAADILFAYPSVGANARRVREIADQFPDIKISVLAENEDQIRQWQGSRLGIFIDINPGMNRTGIEESRAGDIQTLVETITESGLTFRGLHYYDGHHGASSEPERLTAAHFGYDRLMAIISVLERTGHKVEEVITAGTPTFPASLAYPGFRNAAFVHRISPGTVVYCDATTFAQLPAAYGYKPAVLVAARVVSHPRPTIVTCDGGHKAVSADAGVPTCIALGHPELTGTSPSEEHLPFTVKDGAAPPPVGEILYLLPRHICPTVNMFDHALVIRNGAIESVERVTARGRENPALLRDKNRELSQTAAR
ncbi:MAG TPA: alanine racemase [Candidatus Eremiobacteraceae bacterium]|jgi:D-serine deaminase-like pyridoxal phosphate-dependent protein|nr:alanine racemase [Candidatus Eremiobacteraceae bacterium]